MKPLFVLCSLLASSQLIAAQQIILEDGRHVQLNDDFTWQYVNTSEENSADSLKTSSLTPAVAIPVTTNKTGTLVNVGSSKPTMQLSDSGIDILLGAANYQDGQLVIPTSLTNQSRQAVIAVELEIEVLDSTGNELTAQNVKIWSSIKRMADTYLRPQQIAEGKPIKISLESAKQYQINVTVTNIESR
ncbi:DUF3157 family protein [Vibrio sp. TBV020]|uniref:DUF3157 family protein n=1 Tax=Vibrio sp. TBV020 TaxID=3137398 RepID=UPI0038CDC864